MPSKHTDFWDESGNLHYSNKFRSSIIVHLTSCWNRTIPFHLDVQGIPYHIPIGKISEKGTPPDDDFRRRQTREDGLILLDSIHEVPGRNGLGPHMPAIYFVRFKTRPAILVQATLWKQLYERIKKWKEDLKDYVEHASRCFFSCLDIRKDNYFILRFNRLLKTLRSIKQNKLWFHLTIFNSIKWRANTLWFIRCLCRHQAVRSPLIQAQQCVFSGVSSLCLQDAIASLQWIWNLQYTSSDGTWPITPNKILRNSFLTYRIGGRIHCFPTIYMFFPKSFEKPFFSGKARV